MSNVEALGALHTLLIDAQKGYQTAIADADRSDMKAIFEQMSALHTRAHAHVHAILIAKGQRPDESGSFLSLVHKTVISVRSAIKGLDPASLPSFAEGEDRIVAAYDRAISETEGADPALETLRKDQQALQAAILEIRAKAA